MKIKTINKNKCIIRDYIFCRDLSGILPNIIIYERDFIKIIMEQLYTNLCTLRIGKWRGGLFKRWWASNRILSKWYAMGINRMVYPNYRNDYFGNYTDIVEDLIDSDNSFDDNVNGYIIRQIEIR